MKTLNKTKSLIILCLTALICFITSFAVFANVAKADTVTVTEGKAEIYQLAPDPYSLLESYVIKTAEGKLIVIDGGIDGADNEDVDGVNGINATPYITSALRAIAGVGAGEAFEVEAWILSHAHGDHYMELAKILNAYTSDPFFTGIDITDDGIEDIAMETDTNFTINNFYFDFPKDIATNGNISGDYSPTLLQVLVDGFETYAEEREITYDTNTYSSYYDSLNGSVINADMIKNNGWMNIAGLDFEFLQTYSVKDTSVNSNSLVFRVWLDGQSVLFLNDSTEESGRRLINTYGADFIKSDIVQMAHHGQSGVDEATYNAIDAEVRLWAANNSVWFDMDTTKAVRGWVGLSEEAFSANTTKDLVAALSTHPTDFTSVDAWTAVLDGMKISFPYDGAYKSDIQMNKGASIRLTDGSTGIRFSATLTKYDTDATYGFVIAPTSYFTKHNITSDYVEQLTTHYGEDGFINIESAVLPEGLHYIVQGSIANIKYQNMNRSFTGIAYELKDGVYTYAQYDSLSDISRSVKNVAVDAYNYHYYDENGEYYETEDLDVINGFVKSAIDQANGISEADSKTANTSFDLAMTSTSATLEWAETVDLGFSSPYANEDIKWSYDSSVLEITDGVAKAVGVGSTTVTASCFGKSVSANVTVNEEEGYLASFDKEAYTITAEKNTRPLRDAAHLTAEWKESVTDSKGVTENGVLTVTSAANIYAGGIADIIIDLPKPATTAGVTVRLMIEQSNATAIYFRGEKTNGVYDPGYSSRIVHPTTGAAEFTSVADAKGKWLTYFVDYSAAERFDKLELLVAGGGTLDNTIIHFAAVVPGNQVTELEFGAYRAALASQITKGYYADFATQDYMNVIEVAANSANSTASITTFDGKSVLKLATTATASSAGWTRVNIALPIAHEGTYTTKFYLETVSGYSLPNYVRVNTTGKSNAQGIPIHDKEYNNVLSPALADTWTEVTITRDANYSTDYINFNFMFWHTTDTYAFNFYVEGIYDKETVLAGTKAALIDALPTGYIANLNDVGYLNYVTFDGSNSGTYSTSIATIGDATALKISVSEASGKWGKVYLDLFSNMPTNYTVKVYFEAVDGGSLPNYFRFNNVAGYTGGDTEINSQSYAGAWKEFELSLKSNVTDFDTYNFQWICTAGALKMNLYVAAIYDTAKVEFAKELDSLSAGYCVDFNASNTGDLLAKAQTSGTYVIDTFSATQTTFDGATVAKIDITDSSWGAFTLTLPKAYTSGDYSIRFYMDNKGGTSYPNYFRINNDPTFTNVTYDIEYGPSTSPSNASIWNTWNTFSPSTGANSAVIDYTKITFVYVNTSGSSDFTMYIDYVIDADLASYVTEGYCADFANPGYLDLISTDGTYAPLNGIYTKGIVPTHSGETNVLKIVASPNSSNNSVGMNIGLPVAHSGTYTIKLMALLENGSGAVEIRGDTKVGVTVDGAWHEITVTGHTSDTDNIYVYCWAPGATLTLYVSYVYNGNLAEDLSSVNSLPATNSALIIFADCPPMNDSTRLGWYKDAGFTHYLMTEDYVSLFTDAANGDYSLNANYIKAMERAVAADLKVIMRNHSNDPHYFDNLSPTDIEKLQSLVVGYYMCDEPAIAAGYNFTHIGEIEDYLVAWYNENGGDGFFHVNLLQTYGMALRHGTSNTPTFENYLNTYVESVVKNVNGTVTLSTDNYPILIDDTLRSNYLYDLMLIANTARDLKLVGYDVLVNYCIQMCEDAGLNIRQPETIEEIRLQTNIALALGAESFEYFSYYDYILTNNESTSTDYEWVKTVNAEAHLISAALYAYDYTGAQFISCGNNTVTGLENLTVSKFNKLKGVTATADTLVSEFKKASGEYAYMAVNYNTLNTQSAASTVTFNFATDTTAAIVVIDGVSKVVNVVANTLAVELAAGSSVVVYPTVM